MKPLPAILCLWLGVVLAAPAGTITGTVRASGKPEAAAGSDPGKYESRKFKFVERINYEAMRDFVVYLVGPVPGDWLPPAQPYQVISTRKITQKGAQFYPHVLPVVAGTTIEWPNHDDIFHNVFSISDPKPFDLGLYKNGEIKRVLFEKAGRVDVFCSIHTSMSCVVLVLENPYFSATDSKGRYSIAGVPPGVYKIKAWHERLPPQLKDITVPATGDLEVDFTLGITGLPQY